MGRNDGGSARQSWPITVVAAAGLAVFALPAFAQHAAFGHASAGHPGHMTAIRPMGPSRTMGSPMRTGQRMGTVRPNSFGAFRRTPSWERPNYVTPHWEIPSSLRRAPNRRHDGRFHHHGDRFFRHRGAFGGGYAGFPYYGFPNYIDYIDPLALADADMADMDDDNGTGQQAQPNAPISPDYGQQQPPYGEGSYDEGYRQGYPTPRAPYNPGAYSPSPPQQAQPNNAAAQSAATQSDGLDHPAVTLVFNDGRPSQKVHSYVLTGSSVFIAESGHQRIIPVAALNLPETIAQNREAGIDFELPSGKK